MRRPLRFQNAGLFRNSGKESLLAYFLASPALLVFAAIVLFPAAYCFYLSLCNFSILHFDNYRFAGPMQYREIIATIAGGDFEFLFVLGRTLAWTFFNTALTASLSLFIASRLLSVSPHARTVYRCLIIIPWIVPPYIAVLTWKALFNQDFGLINRALVPLGIDPVRWLSDPLIALAACAAVNIWMSAPFMIVTAANALASLDRNLIEAAMLDGASERSIFFRIKLPCILPVMLPAIVFSSMLAFRQFDIVFLMTGGMGGKTDLITTYAYSCCSAGNYSLGAAFSVMIFVILGTLVFINMKLFGGRT